MVHAAESKKFPLFAIALGVLMAGCGVSEAPVDGTTDETVTGSEELRRRDPCMVVRCASGTHCVSKGQRAECVPNTTSGCTSDIECRVFDNYCDGCSCQALSSSELNPSCSGTIVSCFVAPCMNKQAVCYLGKCVIQ